MGGFTGRVPYPTPALLHRLVDSGELRYVGLHHPRTTGRQRGAGQNPAPLSPGTAAVTRWVTAHCTPVPPKAYGGPSAVLPQLYRCPS
jgi:hypothetical protein